MDREFAPTYCNFTTKTVINSEYDLKKSFQEFLYKIDNWINEGPGWAIELIKAEYVSVSIYNSLSGSSYTDLPAKLTNSIKGPINIKNNDKKCFLWCYIRYLNPLKTHAQRITKADKNMTNDLDYEDIKFFVYGRDYCKIEQKITFALTCFFMKIIWFILFMYQIKNVRTVWSNY